MPAGGRQLRRPGGGGGGGGQAVVGRSGSEGLESLAEINQESKAYHSHPLQLVLESLLVPLRLVVVDHEPRQ